MNELIPRFVELPIIIFSSHRALNLLRFSPVGFFCILYQKRKEIEIKETYLGKLLIEEFLSSVHKFGR